MAEKTETTILDEGAVSEIEVRPADYQGNVGGCVTLSPDERDALCVTVKAAWKERDDALSLLENSIAIELRNADLQSQLEQLRAENEALRKEVANSEKYQAQLLDSDSPDQVKPGEM